MPDGIDAIVKKLGEAKYRYGDVVKTNNGGIVVITGYEADNDYPYIGEYGYGEHEWFADSEIAEILKPSPYFPQHADTPTIVQAASFEPTQEEAQQYFRNVKPTQLDWMEWEFLSGKGLAAKGIRHNYFIHPSCSLHIGSEYICSIRVKTEVKDIDGLKKIADDHNKDLFLAEINMVVDPGPEEAQQPTPLMLESRPDEPTSKELRIVWDTDTPGEWVAVVGELTLAMSVCVSPHFVGRVYHGGKLIHRITDKGGEKVLDALTTFVADKL